MSNLPATTSALVGALTSVTTAIESSSGDMPFLRLLKSGEWVYGGDDVDVEEGSEWAVNPNSFGVGYQCWNNDGDLLGEEITLVTEPPFPKSSLEDTGYPWKPLVSASLVCVVGADKGTTLIYKTTSKGGIKALSKLMKSVVSQAQAGETAIVPIVELDKDSYKHKTYGRIYTPVLKVLEWEELDATERTQSEPEPEPAPKKATRKKSEPAAEPEPEEPAPTRTRRRRAS